MSIIADWCSIREKLLPSIERTCGTHNEEAVVAMLLTNRAKLWITPGGSAAITEVVEFPLLKALNIFLVGGDLRDLRDLEPKLINYAISIGCKRITGGGRDGWSGTESDWKKAGVLMYKDIAP